jgi:hypothetical protein
MLTARRLRGNGARSLTCTGLVAYGAAGLAAGLAPISAGLAAAAGLDSLEADASGADGAVSSDLLQAAPRNNATSARSRTLRIASSLNSYDTLTIAQKPKTPLTIRYERANFKHAASLRKIADPSSNLSLHTAILKLAFSRYYAR